MVFLWFLFPYVDSDSLHYRGLYFSYQKLCEKNLIFHSSFHDIVFLLFRVTLDVLLEMCISASLVEVFRNYCNNFCFLG